MAVVILAALALALLLGRCAKPAGDSQGGGPGAAGGRHGRGGGGGGGGRPPTTVGVARAAPGDVPIEISALGTVTPLATVQVQPRVGGQLMRLGFREGQSVRKGQLLALIDPRPFQAALGQAAGQLARDQAALAQAQQDLRRYQTLLKQDSIAAQTVEDQLGLVRQDQGLVRADEASVANARLNLGYAHVTAPVSGRVGLRQVDLGNQLTANQATPITVVTQMDPISVVFSVPETQIGPVAKRAGAGLPVTALDRAGGAVLAQGRLTTLDNLIDPTTGTVKARAVFANPGAGLFPNQFVDVVLLVDTLHGQIVVPTTAVRHGPNGDYVWVLQPDRTVKARPVKVGSGTAETVSIAQGLASGETVITDGGDNLREGARVILPGQSARGGGRGGGQGWQGHGGRRHHGGGAAGAGNGGTGGAQP